MLNKWTDAAIKYHLQMHWKETRSGLELLAMTVMAENGGHKYRILYKTENVEQAFTWSIAILTNGGKLDCSTLLEDTFWQFGWDPRMIPLRDKMRTLHQSPGNSLPTDWYGLKEWREGREVA